MDKNDPPTQPKESGSEEKSTDRHVYVEPGVKIDLVDDLRKQQQTYHEENTAQQRKQYFWTKVAAGLILLYTLFSGWQVKIARDTFNAANRPYVGVGGVGVNHIGKNASGEIVVSQTRTKETVALNVTPQIKNFGLVPGTNFFGKWRVFIAGVEQPHWEIPNRPTTIFPTQTIYITGQVRPPEYPGVMSGEKVLAFEMTIEYDGPSSHYKECNRFQYDPPTNSFFNLGPICID
jgi:hypothetical protein